MLLINDEAIFVHMPRTGGMFTRKIIESADLDHKQINYTHGSINRTHDGIIDTSKYYSFGFVKNPWAWTVSIAIQFGGYQTNIPIQIFERELINFIGDKSLQSRYYDQFHYGNELAVTDVFKVEDLEQSLNSVFIKFGWNRPSELINMTPINTKLSTSGRSYRDFYTERTKQLIYYENQDIIEKYGYSF